MAATAAQNMAYVSRNGSNTDGNAPENSTALMTARQRDTAQYIADMILELRNMAKGTKLHAVMVPLEYAYYEAFSAANRVHVTAEEVDRINRLSKTVEEMEAKAEVDY